MVSFPLSVSKTLAGKSNHKVVYGVGQPMGLYSSWAGLAITNHFIVRLSAQMCGKINFSDYFVLGDDVVIFEENVAKVYIAIMNSFGVDCKPADSIKPHKSNSLEIAKRLFRDGFEISPPPTRLIKRDLSLFFLSCLDKEYLDQTFLTNPGTLKESLIPSLLLYVSQNDTSP